MGTDELYPPDRLAAAQRATAAAGLDALLLTPGSDLRYLTGYDAHAGERLTCLVLPAEGEPTLIVPTLERPAAEASPAPATGVRIVDHADGTDPYPLVRAALPGPAAARRAGRPDVGRAGPRAARRAARRRASGSPARCCASCGSASRRPRWRRCAEAGAAIDAVHARMGEWLRPGRTEAEVAADIAAAIRAAGHVTVDFVIVAAGPNGASPHHGTSDRPIGAGEPVVVDIGGTMPSGYRSDCTRTYVAGGPAPAEFPDYYAVLHEAQRAAVAAVRPGDHRRGGRRRRPGPHRRRRLRRRRSCTAPATASAWTATRSRTSWPATTGRWRRAWRSPSNPASTWPGRHGARIEDIVVCTTDGVQRLNTTPTELIAL